MKPNRWPYLCLPQILRYCLDYVVQVRIVVLILLLFDVKVNFVVFSLVKTVKGVI